MTRRPRSLGEIAPEIRRQSRFRFGEFTLDEVCWILRRGDSEIPLAPQPFRLLSYLIRNRDRVVSKEELVAAAWPGLAISDAALASALNAARRAIGDDGLQQRAIVTYRKRGYRFIAPAEELSAPGQTTRGGASARHPIRLGGEFVGRAAEIADVVALLERNRLVTLTGVGGSGKTRLAAAVAGLVQDRHPDGVFEVSLGALAEGSLVEPAVADAVGMATTAATPDRDMADQIVRYLGGSHALLVLDGCEHVREPCARLAERIASACPSVVVLATSRTPLNVAGEHTWEMPRLSLASPCTCAAPAECRVAARLVEEHDAVRLFVERVRTRLPGFTISPENCRVVAELCRRLEGLPLAIELAAGRVGALGLETLAGEIDAGVPSARTFEDDSSLRRHSLEATIAWSYAVCEETERVLLRRASVFVVGCSLEALEAVTRGDGLRHEDIPYSVSSLIDGSLLTIESGSAAPRYYMPRAIREYAAERLAAAGETDRVRKRHMEWCASRADRVELDKFGSLGRRAAQWLGDDAENLRTATIDALAAGRHDVASKIAARTWPCWLASGRTADTERLLRACLNPTTGAEDTGETLALRLGMVHVEMIRNHFSDAFDEAGALVVDARSSHDEAIVPVVLTKQAIAGVAL